MSDFDEYQRRRRMRPNALLWIRHDVQRFMPPGSPLYVGEERLKYFFPEPAAKQAVEQRCDATGAQSEAELLEYRRELAKLRFDWEMLKLAIKAAKYSPNQPRVPAGNPDGGQWTSEGGQGSSSRVRLAAADKVLLGAAAGARLLFEAAKKIIDEYRSKERLRDLLEDPVGTVAYTEIEGEKIFGVNFRSPNTERIDNHERDRLIARYIELNPNKADEARRGEMPYDAFKHAETSVLLRAARKYGGNLSGREFDVFVDKKICNNCEAVLPFVGTELGNPTVTFFDRRGRIGTIRDGVFHRARRR